MNPGCIRLLGQSSTVAPAISEVEFSKLCKLETDNALPTARAPEPDELKKSAPSTGPETSTSGCLVGAEMYDKAARLKLEAGLPKPYSSARQSRLGQSLVDGVRVSKCDLSTSAIEKLERYLPGGWFALADWQ